MNRQSKLAAWQSLVPKTKKDEKITVKPETKVTKLTEAIETKEDDSLVEITPNVDETIEIKPELKKIKKNRVTE